MSSPRERRWRASCANSHRRAARTTGRTQRAANFLVDIVDSTAQSKSRSDAKIVIERTYRANIQDVWDLWTTKDGFESWWGPQGFRAEVHELVARVGGPLRYDMIADSPEMIAAMKHFPASRPTRATSRRALLDR